MTNTTGEVQFNPDKLELIFEDGGVEVKKLLRSEDPAIVTITTYDGNKITFRSKDSTIKKDREIPKGSTIKKDGEITEDSTITSDTQPSAVSVQKCTRWEDDGNGNLVCK
jgi:hypothetical protein